MVLRHLMRVQSYPHTHILEPEKYLHVINSFWARKQLAKLLERRMRTCTMCDLGCVKDEYHLLIIIYLSQI